MIDAEIIRMRRLRDAALGARALARALDPAAADPAVTAAALLCWSISKTAAGRLRAHPYPEFQRDQSTVRQRWDDLSAMIEAAVARRLGRGHQTLADDMRAVARELDRSRALSRLQELSDAFGRMQMRMQRVREDLDQGARAAEHAVRRADGRADGNIEPGACSVLPYLSLSVGE